MIRPVAIATDVLRCGVRMRQDDDSTNARTVRLTVPDAAGVLGISAEAVRARIKRGTLTTEKDADGSVFVLLDAARTRKDADGTADLALMQAHLDSVMEQVSYLRAVIQTRDEELRRKDHIIAALTERIPELPPPGPSSDARDARVTASEQPGKGDDVGADPQKPSEQHSWLRRFFFGP